MYNNIDKNTNVKIGNYKNCSSRDFLNKTLDFKFLLSVGKVLKTKAPKKQRLQRPNSKFTFLIKLCTDGVRRSIFCDDCPEATIFKLRRSILWSIYLFIYFLGGIYPPPPKFWQVPVLEKKNRHNKCPFWKKYDSS